MAGQRKIMVGRGNTGLRLPICKGESRSSSLRRIVRFSLEKKINILGKISRKFILVWIEAERLYRKIHSFISSAAKNTTQSDEIRL